MQQYWMNMCETHFVSMRCTMNKTNKQKKNEGRTQQVQWFKKCSLVLTMFVLVNRNWYSFIGRHSDVSCSWVYSCFFFSFSCCKFGGCLWCAVYKKFQVLFFFLDNTKITHRSVHVYIYVKLRPSKIVELKSQDTQWNIIYLLPVHVHLFSFRSFLERNRKEEEETQHHKYIRTVSERIVYLLFFIHWACREH